MKPYEINKAVHEKKARAKKLVIFKTRNTETERGFQTTNVSPTTLVAAGLERTKKNSVINREHQNLRGKAEV